ncbi:MAG: potassium channel family protein, partial [Alphaproteobacteria bacterium]
RGRRSAWARRVFRRCTLVVLATVTTVGYGDIAPVTLVGRVVGGFTMIVGISTFALVTAKIAEFLVREESRGGSGAGD